MRVTFNELAERELNEAAQYYEREQPGLGAAFISRRSTLRGIDPSASAGSTRRAWQIRRRLCERFPYGLLYTVSGDEIRVLAVMHLRRRLAYWVGRR